LKVEVDSNSSNSSSSMDDTLQRGQSEGSTTGFRKGFRFPSVRQGSFSIFGSPLFPENLVTSPVQPSSKNLSFQRTSSVGSMASSFSSPRHPNMSPTTPQSTDKSEQVQPESSGMSGLLSKRWRSFSLSSSRNETGQDENANDTHQFNPNKSGGGSGGGAPLPLRRSLTNPNQSFTSEAQNLQFGNSSSSKPSPPRADSPSILFFHTEF